MPDLVKIATASAEYQARFDRPYIGLLGNDRPRVFEAVVAALLPFQFRLANTEFVTAGTLADQKVVFRLPEKGISFQFGAEECRLAKQDAWWSTSDEYGEVLNAAERALLESSGAKVASCMVTLAIHLQPLTKTREEILAPFVPQPFKKFMNDRKAQTFGNHLKWSDGGDVLLDFSIAFANGIFLRLSTPFQGRPSLPVILAKVRRDEEQLFEILGIEEDSDA